MDRREALRRVGMIMGGAVSLPLASSVLSGCQTAPSTASAYSLQTLTPDQDELVATIAELIIPTTDTPGARAALVNEYIDIVATDYMTEEQRTQFVAGLGDADAAAQAAHGSSFVDCTEEQQIALLTEMENEAYDSQGEDPHFFMMMKQMTLTGYYTSEIGATQELMYVHEAGIYRPDIPYSEIGKAYS